MDDDDSPKRERLEDREIRGLWCALREFVRGRVRPPAEPEDIVQEVWLRALQDSRRSPESTHAWMRSVAMHVISDELRAHLRREDHEREVARPARTSTGDADFELGVESVTRCLESLRDPYREVIFLRYRDDLAIADIARRLGRSEGTVRSQIKRGLDLLRRRFADSAENSTRRRRRLPMALAWFRRPPTKGARWMRAAAAALVVWIAASWTLRSTTAPELAVEIAAVPHASEAVAKGSEVDVATVGSDLASERVPVERAQDVATAMVVPGAPLGLPVTCRAVFRVSGEPIAGARVESAHLDGSDVVRLGVTDERGECFATVADFPTWIWAEHDDYSPTSRKLLDAEYARSGEPLLLVAARVGHVSGVVVGPEGEPVGGARVVVEDRGRPYLWRDAQGLLEALEPPMSCTTDDAGEFVQPIAVAGRAKIEAHAEGYARWSGFLTDGKEPMRIVLAREDATASLDRATSALGSSLAADEEQAPVERLRDLRIPASPWIQASEAPALDSSSGSITGRLASSAPSRGSGLEVRLDSEPRGAISLRAACDSDGRFRVPALRAGRYALYVEGGGAHGAWHAETLELVDGERRDLGVLLVPSPGSVLARARPAVARRKEIATFWLRGEGSDLRAHFRTQGLGIEIDRQRSTIEIGSVWPGEYRLTVSGELIADAVATVSVREGAQSDVALALVAATRIFVAARPARQLLEGERCTLFVHTATETREVESDTNFFEAQDGALLFNVGVTPDTERLELRTSEGLVGELRVAGVKPTRDPLEMELR